MMLVRSPRARPIRGIVAFFLLLALAPVQGVWAADCEEFFSAVFQPCYAMSGWEYDMCEENAVIAWFNCEGNCYYNERAAWPEC